MLVKTRSGSRAIVAARHLGIDRLRGLAIALMLLDHVLVVSGHEHSIVRLTVTRASMPLFFVIAGHLARRLTRRHAEVFAWGLLLPLAVPFLDSRPNVLVLYVVGALFLAGLRRIGGRWQTAGLAVLVLLPLTISANGWAPPHAPGSYAPYSMYGLMALGQLLPRDAFGVAERLPGWLGRVGRYPLTVYVVSGLLLAIPGWLT